MPISDVRFRDGPYPSAGYGPPWPQEPVLTPAPGYRSESLIGWQAYLHGWSALHGGYDVDRAAPIVRGWLRLAYLLARLVCRARIGPNGVTSVGLGLSVAAAVVASWQGAWPVAGALLVVGSAVADTIDGAVAVVSGRVSRLGHVYDSVADRLTEACWLVAFAQLGAPPWVVACCGGLAWLHEYLRARAAVAGMSGVGVVTVGERPTRVLVAVFALFFAGIGGLVGTELAAGTVTAAAAIWAILGLVAFAQLFAEVHRALRDS